MIIFSLIVRTIRALLCGSSPTPEPVPFPTAEEIDAGLAKRASELGLTDLNWKESIVDLLKLLKIRNDFHTRGALYIDLGGEGRYMGSPEQNTWMIARVRERFASGQID